jgi:hypothetical protein
VDEQASALEGVSCYRPAGVAEARDMMWSSGVADHRDAERDDSFADVPARGDAYPRETAIHD